MSNTSPSRKKTTPAGAQSPAPSHLELEDGGDPADEGQRLRQGQFFLAALGYAVAGDRDPAGAADGIFGHHTRGAILQFQADQDLEANGHLDGPTWEALSEAYQEGCEVESPAATTDEGDAALVAQERLGQGIHESASDVLVDLAAPDLTEEEVDMLRDDAPSA